MNRLVLVTGATGFLGTHTTLALLREGFRVRAAVRNVERASRRFTAFVPNELLAQLELVPVDLADDAGWRDAARSCDYVLHLASPVPSGPVRDPDEVIEPARQGTLRMLRAAHSAGVERVVVTSSTAAVIWGRDRSGTQRYDEQHWSVLDRTVGPYERSKTLAEQDAWRFIDGLPEGEGPELVTLLPGALLGPLLDERTSVSVEIVRALLARDLPGIPDLGFALADVRDVAEAHVEALNRPAAAGQRFILAGAHTWMRDIAAVLVQRYASRGFRVPTRRLPSWLLRTIGVWNPVAAMTSRELGKRHDVSSERAARVLGWTPRTTEEMVVAMADSLIAHGVVSARS